MVQSRPQLGFRCVIQRVDHVCWARSLQKQLICRMRIEPGFCRVWQSVVEVQACQFGLQSARAEAMLLNERASKILHRCRDEPLVKRFHATPSGIGAFGS